METTVDIGQTYFKLVEMVGSSGGMYTWRIQLATHRSGCTIGIAA
jgi:hypothetical protein